jgi:hypothetical protein
MRVPNAAGRVLAAVGLAILGLPLTPRSALAQDVPLAHVLPELILREIILDSPPLPPGAPGRLPGGATHTAHFSPIEANELNNPVVGIVQGFNTQMATQFSTFPLGSSSGGMTYVFDETVGTFRRGSSSFGPSFAERALTIGRRKLSAGFNYQRTSYDTFEGQGLDDGSIKFYLRHQDCCTFNLLPEAPFSEFFLQPNGTRLTVPFEGDIIEASLSLEATTHTTAGFASYGVTDRWDIGLAVPFVRVNLDARVQAQIVRLVTCSTPRVVPVPAPVTCAPDVHTFDSRNPNATQTVQHSGQASGLGDLVLRTKYQFLRASGGGLAAAVDVRLPTGDENELLGAGGAQAKFMLVASTERGRVGQHVNVGYTAAEGEVAGTLAGLTSTPLPDEINYSGGIEFVANPRLTVMGDIVGRTLRGAGRLELESKTFEYTDPARFPAPTVPEIVALGILSLPTSSVSLDELNPRPGNLTLLLGTGGVKFNPGGNLLVSASVLFPLTDAGLRSRLTTVLGIDYAF